MTCFYNETTVFDHLKLTSYVSYYNSFPFAIFSFSVVWERNPSIITYRFHITFPPFLLHIFTILFRYKFVHHSGIWITRKFYFYSAYFYFNLLCKKYPGMISIFIQRKLRFLSIRTLRSLASIESQIFANIYRLFSWKNMARLLQVMTYAHIVNSKRK